MTDQHKKHPLLSLKRHRQNIQHKDDPKEDQIIAHLTRHMQELRQSVPVNYQLKQSLKKRLFEKMKEMEERPTSAVDQRKKWSIWTWLGIICASLLACVFIYWWAASNETYRVTDSHQLGPFPAVEEMSLHPVSISADGERMAVEKDNGIIVLDQNGHQQSVHTDEQQGIIDSPSYSNHGRELAFLYHTDTYSEVRIVLPGQMGSRVIYREADVEIQGPLYWSEDDYWLAVTIIDEGKERIWIIAQDGMEIYPAEQDDIDQAWPVMEQQVDAERIKWPRELQNQLDEADRYWMDLNVSNERMAVVIENNGELQYVWIQLRSNRNIGLERGERD